MSEAVKTQNAEFKGFRSIFWPIHDFELKKFLPTAFVMLFIVFNYSTMRCVKDALIVPLCGAEIISALKLFAVLPSAVVFMLVYSKLANVLNRPKLFYTVTSFFALYLMLFVFFLYPNRDALHPDLSEAINSWPRFRWFLLIASHWVLSSFYIMAELWGSVMISLMFWQYANEITSLKEAKRFYSMFGFFSNFGAIAAGNIIVKLSSSGKNIESWNDSLHSIMVFVISSCVIIMCIYWWMERNVLTDKRFYDPEANAGKTKKKKAKMSLGESFKYIFTSKYLGYIVLLIICYGISINLVEGVWKDRMRAFCSHSTEYNAMMGRLQMYTGALSLVMMIVGMNVLRRFSWFASAAVTPVMIMATGVVFFFFVVYGGLLDPTLARFAITPLGFAVYVGIAQNVLAKSTKYSLFDSTKEMSYIPLDDELKVKGKAAVEVVGGRLGKSGGAAIQQLLLFLCPGWTLFDLSPIICVVFLFIVGIWIVSVHGLSREFATVTANKKANVVGK
ncbi:MAG: NTP/NDP exchange transporter [Holosporales bacterium]|jgi:AAA family ATP:ADP antiporter|nr:NTP/NDP exchange transporter [Holosporales bacterium]